MRNLNWKVLCFYTITINYYVITNSTNFISTVNSCGFRFLFFCLLAWVYLIQKQLHYEFKRKWTVRLSYLGKRPDALYCPPSFGLCEIQFWGCSKTNIHVARTNNNTKYSTPWCSNLIHCMIRSFQSIIFEMLCISPLKVV